MCCRGKGGSNNLCELRLLKALPGFAESALKQKEMGLCSEIRRPYQTWQSLPCCLIDLLAASAATGPAIAGSLSITRTSCSSYL